MPFTNVRRPPKPKQSLLPKPLLKPITFTLDADETMTPATWEILRRRVMVAVAKEVTGIGCEVRGDDP